MISIFCTFLFLPIDTQVTFQIYNQSDFESNFILEELPFGYKDTLTLCSGDSALIAWNRDFFYGKINEHLFFADLSQNSSFIFDDTETLIPKFKKDEYMQYLLLSTNHLIAKNSRYLSPTNPPELLLKIFLEEEKKREEELADLKAEIDHRSYEFLSFQNKARIRNFLFYFFREIRSIPLSDSIYNPILIENRYPFGETLPQPILYTYEVNWSRNAADPLSPWSLYQFFQKDYFLAALWVRDILEFPQSWPFLNTNPTEISKIIELDVENPFKSIYTNQVNAFKILEKGKIFPPIEFLNTNNEIVEIEKYKGNFILLDFWAVWCAPCLDLRNILNNMPPIDGIYLISVNLDKNEKIWLDFIEKNHSSTQGFDWYLKDGFSSPIAQELGLAFIPRLILVDKSLKIIDPNFQFNKQKDYRQQLIDLMK